MLSETESLSCVETSQCCGMYSLFGSDLPVWAVVCLQGSVSGWIVKKTRLISLLFDELMLKVSVTDEPTVEPPGPEAGNPLHFRRHVGFVAPVFCCCCFQ